MNILTPGKWELSRIFQSSLITLFKTLFLRPKFAQIARARALPKTQKSYEMLPILWPIVDTASTPYDGSLKKLYEKT